MRVWKYAASAAPEAPKTAPILFTGNICDCLRNAAAAGFDAIEYHTREDADFDYDLIRKTMKATGCRVSMIVTGRMNTEGGLSITSEDPEVEKAALEGMLRYIDMAAEIKSGIVIGWAKGRISLTSGPEAYFERLTRNLRIMDEAAAAKNVPINIEVLNHYETDVFMTAQSLVDYLEEQQFKSCHVHLDTFHMLLEEEDHPQAIRTAAKHLGYVHVADATRWYPGSGTISFKAIMRTLDQVDYEGYICIECFPRINALETASRGLRYLKGIEAGVV